MCQQLGGDVMLSIHKISVQSLWEMEVGMNRRRVSTT